jgi:hypothetical protein
MAYPFENDRIGYVVDLTKLKTYSYEIGSIRPPSEGGSSSLLIRVTRNCPWNKCTFCYGFPYNRERFQLRSIEEIKADVNAAKAISNEIGALSWKLGYAGKIEPLAPEGVIKIKDEYWKAKAVDGNINAGETVEIVEVDGLLLKVKTENRG